jgi:hypothetical protein
MAPNRWTHGQIDARLDGQTGAGWQAAAAHTHSAKQADAQIGRRADKWKGMSTHVKQVGNREGDSPLHAPDTNGAKHTNGVRATVRQDRRTPPGGEPSGAGIRPRVPLQKQAPMSSSQTPAGSTDVSVHSLMTCQRTATMRRSSQSRSLKPSKALPELQEIAICLSIHPSVHRSGQLVCLSTVPPSSPLH